MRRRATTQRGKQSTIQLDGLEKDSVELNLKRSWFAKVVLFTYIYIYHINSCLFMCI